MRLAGAAALGAFVQRNALCLALGAAAALLALAVAIKSAQLDTQLSSWIQRSGRVHAELADSNAYHASHNTLLSNFNGNSNNNYNELNTHNNNNNNHANQLFLTQTSRGPRVDVLTVDALMIHLEALAVAAHLTVDLYDVTWSLKDICFAPTIPDYEAAHMSIMLENIVPCAIKTPLDCFWEGAKLLGPEQPVTLGSMGPKLKWTNLNPRQLVADLQRNHPHASFPYSSLLDWMRRVGVDSGYQQKPCLDPNDPNCPLTAPNKQPGSNELSLHEALRSGCRGFAANLMHWNQDEILGGVVKNKTGHILRAAALQSTVPLMADQEMYDYWRKTSKVQEVNNWSVEKARIVLDTWQRKFREEIVHFTQVSMSASSYNIHAITPQSMLEPFEPSSLLDLTIFQMCFLAMTILSAAIYPNFVHYQKHHNDKTTINTIRVKLLSVATSFMVGLTFVSSLGLSSFMNFPINMATTQILPPLALFYGFNQVHTYATIYSQQLTSASTKAITSRALDEFIPIVMIETISSILALLVASVIPVNATRIFSFQAIAYIALCIPTSIILLPSLVTLFISPASEEQANESESWKSITSILAANRYIHSVVCLLQLCLLIVMLLQASKVKYGIQIKDIVARGTLDYEAFSVQEKYFPIYNTFIVTKGNFDYATNQRFMHELYQEVEKVPGVVETHESDKPKFWLTYFRDWLLELQNRFDTERNQSLISGEGWNQEASESAKLAYKLLAQTGKADNPIDKGLVEINRLVDSNGIINTKAFYYYLAAWVMNDAYTYSMSEANFKPEPKVWNGDEHDLRIERARPLNYAQIPFLLKLPNSHDSLKTISEIRTISQAYEHLGLSNFPVGIPFIFWDQFINLDFLFIISLSVCLASVFLLIGLVISDFTTAAIITVPTLITVLEMYCFLGFMSIPFNNILAVLLIVSTATTTLQTVPYTTFFQITDGDNASRVQKTIERRWRVVLNSHALFCISTIVLYNSSFDFMLNYSCILTFLAGLNMVNSIFFTPVILRVFGSSYEPVKYKSSHETVKVRSVISINKRPKVKIARKGGFPRVKSEISLSTISEESQWEAQFHDLKLDVSITCY